MRSLCNIVKKNRGVGAQWEAVVAHCERYCGSLLVMWWPIVRGVVAHCLGNVRAYWCQRFSYLLAMFVVSLWLEMWGLIF